MDIQEKIATLYIQKVNKATKKEIEESHQKYVVAQRVAQIKLIKKEANKYKSITNIIDLEELKKLPELISSKRELKDINYIFKGTKFHPSAEPKSSILEWCQKNKVNYSMYNFILWSIVTSLCIGFFKWFIYFNFDSFKIVQIAYYFSDIVFLRWWFLLDNFSISPSGTGSVILAFAVVIGLASVISEFTGLFLDSLWDKLHRLNYQKMVKKLLVLRYTRLKMIEEGVNDLPEITVHDV